MATKAEKLAAKAAKLAAAQAAAEVKAQALMGPFGEGAAEDASYQEPTTPEASTDEEVVRELAELLGGTATQGEGTEAPQAAQEAPQAAQPSNGLPTLAPPLATPTGPVLHVKQGLPLRGGRGEWYKLLCKYDGKPVAEYIAEGKLNPASHYTARSTKCGQPKTPESRLSWFKRAGIVTIK